MTALYVAVVGLSAFLLFQVQPMIAKIILPRFGGGASIWLTCLVFFQLVLLLGYASSHWLLTRLGTRRHLLVQALFILVSLAFLPLRTRDTGLDPSTLTPAVDILLLLAASVGLPYFVLSTTSPAIQHWIGVGPGARMRNPYILYAVSNAGSLLGLLAYPVLVEPNLPNRVQLGSWSVAFGVYAVLLLAGIALRWKTADPAASPLPDADRSDPESGQRGDRIRWVILSLIPSAALIAITHHLTVDIANLPFLWVLPLALYLMSFIICFLFPGISRPRYIRSMLVLAALLAVALIGRGAIQVSLITRTLVACSAILAVSTYFHGELERSKPPVHRLTSFYLYLALGACAGSVLIGLVAPLVLRGSFEFTLVILVSLYGVLFPYVQPLALSSARLCHSFMALLLVLSFLNEEVFSRTDSIWRGRSFYGTYKIREVPELPDEQVAVRLLMQGTTIHGGQARYPDGRFVPLTYYFEKTAIGQAFAKLPDIERVGVVGLGAGAISVYGRKGQTLDFFEIDQMSIDIATNQFQLLESCPAEVRIIKGDGRLALREVGDATYDLLILDAFTSGTIPLHLLTLEAIEEYLRVLKPEGLLLYHISNRHVRLQPVLAGAADQLGLRYAQHKAPRDGFYVMFEADWVALTRSPEILDRLTDGDDDWEGPPPDTRIWTDEASDLWSVIDWSR